jgi:hypothetical protein
MTYESISKINVTLYNENNKSIDIYMYHFTIDVRTQTGNKVFYRELKHTGIINFPCCLQNTQSVTINVLTEKSKVAFIGLQLL